MKKIFRHVHLWLSLPAGIVLIIICLTGSILVYEDELTRLAHPGWYYTEQPGSRPMPLDKLIPQINAQLDSNQVASIQMFSDPKRNYIATLSKGSRISAFIDPYTAKVTGIYHYREGFFSKVMALHRWLMDPGRTAGKLITGISTIFMVIILISGIWVWFPRSLKKPGQFFLIKWRAGTRRLLYDLHRIGGIYAVIFLLLLSLTGLMWSFQWYRSGVMQLFRAETATTTASSPHKKAPKPESDLAVWQQATENVMKITAYSYLKVEEGTVTVLPPDAPHKRATDQYRFDPTGTVSHNLLYSERHDPSKIMGWAYALHTGSWGGGIMRFLTFFAALLGASLPITGYILYFKRIRKRK